MLQLTLYWCYKGRHRQCLCCTCSKHQSPLQPHCLQIATRPRDSEGHKGSLFSFAFQNSFIVSFAHKRPQMIPGHLGGNCHVVQFASNERLRNDKCSFIIGSLPLVHGTGGLPWTLTLCQKVILPHYIGRDKESQGQRRFISRHIPICGLQPHRQIVLMLYPQCYLLP